MVLFVFVIMLLNAGKEQKSKKRSWVKFAGVPLLLVLLGPVSFLVQSVIPETEGVTLGGFTHGSALDIGRALFTTYLAAV